MDYEMLSPNDHVGSYDPDTQSWVDDWVDSDSDPLAQLLRAEEELSFD